MQQNIPIPTLYRTTNNNIIPKTESIWVSDMGKNIVVVTKKISKKTPVIICYRTIEIKDKTLGPELSVSLQKFHSLFSSFENKDY
tara:strand:- start:643 stop:897 length:255 start_codon:yes stop_codon:yes gene_type:complete